MKAALGKKRKEVPGGGGGCVFGEKMINCVWFSSVEDSKREEKPIVKSGRRKCCWEVGDMYVGECYTCMCGGWGNERLWDMFNMF